MARIRRPATPINIFSFCDSCFGVVVGVGEAVKTVVGEIEGEVIVDSVGVAVAGTRVGVSVGAVVVVGVGVTVGVGLGVGVGLANNNPGCMIRSKIGIAKDFGAKRDKKKKIKRKMVNFLIIINT